MGRRRRSTYAPVGRGNRKEVQTGHEGEGWSAGNEGSKMGEGARNNEKEDIHLRQCPAAYDFPNLSEDPLGPLDVVLRTFMCRRERAESLWNTRQ